MGVSLRVLIVEDSENDALLLVDALELGGFDLDWERVETANSMGKALDDAAWDIVVADCALPNFSGRGALELARQKDPDLPLILVSGTWREDDAVEAMRTGARDFIPKNNLSRLVPAVERELVEAETRRKRYRAEEALRATLAVAEQRRRLLETVMEHVPDGITVADAPNGDIRMVSRYGQDLLGGLHHGMQVADVIERWNVFQPDGVTPMLSDETPLMRAIRQGEIIRDQEIVQVNNQGQKLCLLCNAAPIRSEDGTITGGVVAWRDITERKQAEERERKVEQEKVDFYRRTILAATGGKLVIADRTEMATIAGSVLRSWKVNRADDLVEIRHQVVSTAESLGMEVRRAGRFALAIGEAGTNAVKHAKGGKATLYKQKDGLLFEVSDTGPGIAALALPDVALTRGYSTAGTLGMGYKVMMQMADKVYLVTGPEGTTVGIQMDLKAQERQTTQAGADDVNRMVREAGTGWCQNEEHDSQMLQD